MRLLLDTQAALWAVVGSHRLTSKLRSLIEDNTAEVNISVATLWEIAIKHARNRGTPWDMPVSADEAEAHFLNAGYRLLPILPAHAIAVQRLPALHADPFDRILVAQALTEPMRLITSDRTVARYSDTITLI